MEQKLTTNTNSGFTLIELLIVIAIIGLLAGVIFLAVQNARIRARDAKRAADMRQMVSAMEQYQISHGAYPTGTLSKAGIGTGVSLDDHGAMDGAAEPFVPNFIPIFPVAPLPGDGVCASDPGRGNNNYWYDVADDGLTYTLTYCLGKQTGGFAPGVHFETPNGAQ
jgi:prepilin-type N-terminal cleavage/methylation domain-containing protein